MKKLYSSGNYIVYENGSGTTLEYPKGFTVYTFKNDVYQITEQSGVGIQSLAIPVADISNIYDEAGSTAYSEATLLEFLRLNTGFKSASGGSGAGASGTGTPYVISSDDATVYADSAKGVKDPNGIDGLHFTNSSDPTNKINWYYLNNANRTSQETLTTLQGGYAIITVYATGVCYFNVYTKRKNDGNDVAWYRSRVVYLTYNSLDAYVNQRVVIYWGQEPDVYPDLPRVEMVKDTISTVGPEDADEEIFLSSLNTSTNYPAGTYSFTAQSLGYINSGIYHNFPCTYNEDTTVLASTLNSLSNSVSSLSSFLNAVNLGRFFRGYVMDEAEMLALASPVRYQYVVRVDTETIWEFDGVDFYDTGIVASVSGIAQEEELVLAYSNTHYIDLDGANDYINLTNVDTDILDFTKEWSIGYNLENVSTVNDGTKTTLFKRGNNEITLLKGGSNWGIYIYANGTPIAQANTWYAPQQGSNIFIVCTGTRLRYYLDGNLRANMVFNANISNNDPVGDLQIGNGGSIGSNWFGGVNNLMLMVGSQALLGADERAEYFSKQDATTLSFYPSVFDFIPLGERPYPNVLGLKQVVEGTLENGTESNYYQRPIPGALGVPFTDYPGEYIKLDGTNNYIEFTNADTDVLDFTKQWAVSLKLKSVSGVNDSSYTIVYKRGNNEITLRKGGSNWGIYVYANGTAIAQANTWYAPTFDSDVVFICTGTRLEYYLNGVRRAFLTFNSNVSNNDPVGNLLIGKNGNNGGYWYGGIDNAMLLVGANSQLTSTQVNEYRNNTVPTQLSYYSALLDYVPFGADSYPTVAGLKGNVSGSLVGGQPEDFVNI
jgi:hypothetical protein